MNLYFLQQKTVNVDLHVRFNRAYPQQNRHQKTLKDSRGLRAYTMSTSKVPWVSGRHCVSVVLIRCLLVDAPYILGHVVDHACDTPVESFVVHSLNIGQVGSSYKGRQALFLIFHSNIPFV